MAAKGITKVLQEQFVDQDIVDGNFQCTVFNDPKSFELIGEGWILKDDDLVDRSAACLITKKRIPKERIFIIATINSKNYSLNKIC